MVEWRRTIHRNPKLVWQEKETAQLVHNALTQHDVPATAGVAKTGVVATLDSGIPGPTVLL